MVCFGFLTASYRYHSDPDAKQMIQSDMMFAVFVLHSNKDQPLCARGQKQSAVRQGETHGALFFILVQHLIVSNSVPQSHKFVKKK